nr:uncharacterized protein LOC113703357 [Coffea arabica]
METRLLKKIVAFSLTKKFSSCLRSRSSFYQSAKLPNLPPLRLAVLILTPLGLPRLHLRRHPLQTDRLPTSASSYIRWILDWSGSSARCLVWRRIWLNISPTWTSVHPFLPSLSTFLPSFMFREVLLLHYFYFYYLLLKLGTM